MNEYKEIQFDVDIANEILKEIENRAKKHEYDKYAKAFDLLESKNLVKKNGNNYQNTVFASDMIKNNCTLAISDFREPKEDSGIVKMKINVANAIIELGKIANETAIVTISDNIRDDSIKIVGKELCDMGIVDLNGELTDYGRRLKNNGKKLDYFSYTDFTNEIPYIEDIDKNLFSNKF